MDKLIVDKLSAINSKLGILIALQMIEEKPSKQKEKIKLLDELGIETAEIASILGTSPGLVAKEKSLIKKEKKQDE